MVRATGTPSALFVIGVAPLAWANDLRTWQVVGKVFVELDSLSGHKLGCESWVTWPSLDQPFDSKVRLVVVRGDHILSFWRLGTTSPNLYVTR